MLGFIKLECFANLLLVKRGGSGHFLALIGRAAFVAVAVAAAGPSAAGLSELFVPDAGEPAAVEWETLDPAEFEDDGVTLVAVRLSGRSSAIGLIVGAWHAPVTSPTVIWHEGDASQLAGYVNGQATTNQVSISLPATVDWDDVGWAVFAGDATAAATETGATLTSASTRLALGALGLVGGASVGPAGGSPWVPTPDALNDLGGLPGDWASVAVDGPGVYRPDATGAWRGGPADPSGQVLLGGDIFDATPGFLNGPIATFHYPEPATAAILLVALGVGLAKRPALACRRCDAARRGI